MTASPRAAPRLLQRSPSSSQRWRKFLIEAGYWSGRRSEEEATDIFAYLNGLTLVTEERCLEDAVRAMEETLTKARLVVNGIGLDINNREA